MEKEATDTTKEEKPSKCKHYKRRCVFISPCCGKLYPCRLCHDEVENHTLDRYAVKEIQCTECQIKQQVGKECSQCSTVFGEYFCSICRLYDDTPKQQFHCDRCGLCRVGGRDNFFHCDRCDMCLGVSLKDKHKCVEKVSRSNCPVCMEDLHTSTNAVTVPRCHHMLHNECYAQLLRSGNYTCPTCNESLVNMKEYWKTLDDEIAHTPMPEEYRDHKVHVLCRDCHKTTETVFHIIGQKCQACGSYNTCGTDGPDDPVNAAGAQDHGDVDIPEVLHGDANSPPEVEETDESWEDCEATETLDESGETGAEPASGDDLGTI